MRLWLKNNRDLMIFIIAIGMTINALCSIKRALDVGEIAEVMREAQITFNPLQK